MAVSVRPVADWLDDPAPPLSDVLQLKGRLVTTPLYYVVYYIGNRKF